MLPFFVFCYKSQSKPESYVSAAQTLNDKLAGAIQNLWYSQAGREGINKKLKLGFHPWPSYDGRNLASLS